MYDTYGRRSYSFGALVAAVTLGLCVAAGGMFAALVFGGKTQAEGRPIPTITVTIPAPQAPTPATEAATTDQGWSFGPVSVVPGWSGQKVAFAATNTTDVAQSVAITVTGLDKNGQPVASFGGSDSDVPAGKTVRIEAYTIDRVPQGIVTYDVHVDLTY